MDPQPMPAMPSPLDRAPVADGNADLWIDKERVQVRARLAGGVEIVGHLFLFLERTRPLWKRMLEHLNEPTRFFPIGTAEGATVLVARDQVVELLLVEADPANLESESAPFGSLAKVRTRLSDGSTI